MNPAPGGEWMRVFLDEERAKWTPKLANMMLINGARNSKMGNSEYAAGPSLHCP